ncbi:MAG: GNAT family N-acetyltransferase [Ruminococcus sp.]|nr:GNAT family N-acetyltransferase [Ruminococcus sp.]MBQ5316402.1 GNAT family N-acetyltransferase [Oscillospiraceae bacterium]
MKTLMILSTVPDERLETVLHEAKHLGYRTLFCGEDHYTTDEVPADRVVTVCWSNTRQLIDIAEEEKIDGVVGLCDPAVIPAAEIAQALGLMGNSPLSVKQLLSRTSFREVQEKAGVFCPRHAVISSSHEMRQICESFGSPVIVKPMLSSSSHGMTVLNSMSDAKDAFDEAAAVSRNGSVCVEQFIGNDTLRVIENDIFVMEDEILWDGIRYCYRLPEAPLRPVYDVYPVCMSKQEEEEYRHSVSAVLKQADIRFGEFNVEGFFTSEGRFFIVEINPRPGGHYTPQTVQMYTGMNLTKLLITAATGDHSYYDELKAAHRERKFKYLLDHSVFSKTDGVLDHIHIDPSLKEKLRSIRYLHGQKEGDRVRNIVDAVRPIAITVFAFDEKETLERVRKNITKLVYPVLKDEYAGRKSVFELEDTSKVSALFKGWEQSIIYSCLQGRMGKILVTDTENPGSACAVLGCFGFYSGRPEPELLHHRAHDYFILVPQTAEWAKLIEEQIPAAIRITRYATKKDTHFDAEQLRQNLELLPEGYELKKIDSELYDKCFDIRLTSDFVSAFKSKEEYLKHGRGVVILKDGKIVSGASSLSYYDSGIELEVDTVEPERNKHLALVSASALILNCLDEGIYPSVDLHSEISLHCAEKLGYEFDHEYVAYEVRS